MNKYVLYVIRIQSSHWNKGHTNTYWNHCELRIFQMCLCAYICVYVFMYVFMCVNVNVLCVSIYMLIFPTAEVAQDQIHPSKNLGL